mmetsp:Transcript_92743/g.198829  ORF Transcript_92743/g.198829 Transcript_92743/m.198829 type:complete len:273 (+) Transcript_92743:347-1165(+)
MHRCIVQSRHPLAVLNIQDLCADVIDGVDAAVGVTGLQAVEELRSPCSVLHHWATDTTSCTRPLLFIALQGAPQGEAWRTSVEAKGWELSLWIWYRCSTLCYMATGDLRWLLLLRWRRRRRRHRRCLLLLRWRSWEPRSVRARMAAVSSVLDGRASVPHLRLQWQRRCTSRDIDELVPHGIHLRLQALDGHIRGRHVLALLDDLLPQRLSQVRLAHAYLHQHLQLRPDLLQSHGLFRPSPLPRCVAKMVTERAERLRTEALHRGELIEKAGC